MEGNNSEKLNINQKSISSEENLNIDIISGFFKRNKKLISFFAVGGLILSALYSLTIKRTWEGGFQIVLDQEESSLNVGNRFAMYGLDKNIENSNRS